MTKQHLETSFVCTSVHVSLLSKKTSIHVSNTIFTQVWVNCTDANINCQKLERLNFGLTTLKSTTAAAQYFSPKPVKFFLTRNKIEGNMDLQICV